MLFDYDLTVPATTQKDNPAIQACLLTSGILHELRVKFPPGPATLVHVIVKDSLHQLLPTNPDGTLNLDDETVISSNLNYRLSPPYELFIVGWSPYAVYDHVVTVQFDVLPDEPDPFTEFEKLLLGTSKKRK